MVTSKISSDVVGDTNDENNFPDKLLLSNKQVLRIHKTFSSAITKLLKTQLHKIG